MAAICPVARVRVPRLGDMEQQIIITRVNEGDLMLATNGLALFVIYLYTWSWAYLPY